MLKIELSRLQFHSFHGMYAEENTAGGEFEVDLMVYMEPRTIPVQRLSETIDYTLLYGIVKAHMEKPTELIETLATEITLEIFSSFPKAEEVSVSIKKLNPPIPFFNGNVSATYALKRGERSF